MVEHDEMRGQLVFGVLLVQPGLRRCVEYVSFILVIGQSAQVWFACQESQRNVVVKIAEIITYWLIKIVNITPYSGELVLAYMKHLENY